MRDKLKEISKKEIEKLPKEMQDAINAFDWGGVVEEIGKKYSLDETKVHTLQVYTLLVLIGLDDINDYPLNIEKEVGTTKEEGVSIAGEVLEKIFTRVSDSMEEYIKKSGKSQHANWHQNLNFISSGGNYFAFLAPNMEETESGKADRLIGTSNILETKNKLIN